MISTALIAAFLRLGGPAAVVVRRQAAQLATRPGLSELTLLADGPGGLKAEKHALHPPQGLRCDEERKGNESPGEVDDPLVVQVGLWLLHGYTIFRAVPSGSRMVRSRARRPPSGVTKAADES